MRSILASLIPVVLITNSAIKPVEASDVGAVYAPPESSNAESEFSNVKQSRHLDDVYSLCPIGRRERPE